MTDALRCVDFTMLIPPVLFGDNEDVLGGHQSRKPEVRTYPDGSQQGSGRLAPLQTSQLDLL
jgi:hypothetical protein